MDIKKLLEESKSTDENLTATISFKVDPKFKAEFVEHSVESGISMGLLMRNFAKEALKELKKIKE